MAESASRFEDWLSPEVIRELGSWAHDSPELSTTRTAAYEAFKILPLEPNPLYRKYGYFGGVDLKGLNPLPKGPPVARPPWDGQRLRIIHDAAGTSVEIPNELKDAGVTVTLHPSADANGTSGPRNGGSAIDRPADRLTALAVATWNRGYDLTIPPKCSAPVRVQDLTVLSQPHEALSVRRTISVGAESQAIVSEEMYSVPAAGGQQRLATSSVELDIAAACQVAYLGVHAPDLHTISLYQRHAKVGPSAKVGWIWAGFGGFRTKTRNATDLIGQGANADDLQAFFGTGPQAYDSSVNLTHVGTDTHGQSITRGVFRDDARGMSRGLVRIEKDARKTVSYISEHAMLLSRGARSDTIPILEILCRDVKATHSSSVAPVDPEKVFYLESRGLSHDDSVRLIGEGFLAHVLERAPIARLREILYPMLEARWENRTIDWDPGALPALPLLTASEAALAGDWRFDAKLR